MEMATMAPMGLMEYQEWRKANPDFFQSIPDIDPATAEAIDEWFKYRYICDNRKFGDFFKREIELHVWQYKEQLRLQSVTFDPMVSQYLERWINHSGTDTREDTSKESGTYTSNGTRKGKTSDTTTPGITEKRNNKQTNDTTQTTTGKDTETINSTTDVTGSSNGTSTGTSNVTESGTSSGTNKSTETVVGTHKESNMALEGVLPDSSSYGPGATGEERRYGMPNTLDFTYSDNQKGSQGVNTDNTTTTTDGTTGETTGGTKDITDSTTTETSSTGKTTNAGTTTFDKGGTVKDTGTITHEETVTREGTDTQAGTSELTSNDFHDTAVDRTNSGTNTYDHTDKERSTGRTEAPQDMLDRARSYILKMNAFDWFRKRLDICFMAVYDY